jgi:hypothetical protein
LTRHQLRQQIVYSSSCLRRLVLQLAQQQQLVLALVNRRVLNLCQMRQDSQVQAALQYFIFSQALESRVVDGLSWLDDRWPAICARDNGDELSLFEGTKDRLATSL